MEFRAAFFLLPTGIVQRFTWRETPQEPDFGLKIYYNHSEAHETLAA
jgi:hypothetical protein